MSETMMWVVGTLLSIIFGIVGVSLNMVKGSFNQLLTRIDKISETLDIHNEKLIKVLTMYASQSQFIDAHTEEIDQIKRDILDMKINCATNGHKKPK